MEFDGGGGIAGGLGYGNGYTPLANAAIANNNAAYAANQAAMAQAGAYNPFPGGFGAQTAYYAGLGADYGRAVGGGGNIYGPGIGYPSGGVERGPDLPDLSSPTLPGADPYQQWLQAGGYNAPANFADRFSAAPAITPGLQPQGGDYAAFPNVISAGVDPGNNLANNSRSFENRWNALPQQPAQPYPATGIPIMNAGGGPSISGGAGTSWGGASSGPLAGMSARDTAIWIQAMTNAGRASEIPGGFGGASTNTFGYPGSGNLADTPLGQGGIGGDTSRDRMAWTLAQSSPFATAGAPTNGPYPNLGYNPGMANSFAFGGGGQPNFQDRFGMGFPNAGTPSQYTASPYTNVQGQTFQPQVPQGFQQQFDWQTPGGALNPNEQRRVDTWTNAS